ncbi:MAG: calcium/sodium antiporter [Pseudomonadota bacterium]
MDIAGYDLAVLSIGALIAGIWLLVMAGDWAVSAAVMIARRAQLSKMFIGATIIAFGTSVPELFTSVNANLSGFPGISLGNVVGSNIANILLVIGVAAMFHTMATRREEVQTDLAMMLVATVILIGGMIFGIFTTPMGLAMVALLVVYIIYQYRTDSIDTSEIDEIEEEEMSMGRAWGLLIGGLIGLSIGSEILVTGAVTMGRVAGVPEAVIGMTVVAFGTSLPELSAAITAALKRETSLIFGNIIGSNTFNILSIVGITAIVKPLDVETVLVGFDMWFMAGVSLVFAIWLMANAKITRSIGVGIFLCYLAFMGYQYRDVIIS